MMLCTPLALAGAAPVFSLKLTGMDGVSLSSPLQIVLLLTALTLLPAVVMCVTPFLRIVVVLHFLRQALGTQSAPSNQVLIGLSLFLTAVVMRPVVAEAYETAWVPLQTQGMNVEQAYDAASKPLRTFLLRFAREADLKLMIESSKSPAPAKPSDLGLGTLIPAYILSELRTSFQIGAMLYLPFLVVDLVVASLTLSVGMLQLPPAMISAPCKVLLFVLVDGWNLVAGSLLKGLLEARA
jgi:flagellar biosynthesis protein FliP